MLVRRSPINYMTHVYCTIKSSIQVLLILDSLFCLFVFPIYLQSTCSALLCPFSHLIHQWSLLPSACYFPLNTPYPPMHIYLSSQLCFIGYSSFHSFDIRPHLILLFIRPRFIHSSTSYEQPKIPFQQSALNSAHSQFLITYKAKGAFLLELPPFWLLLRCQLLHFLPNIYNLFDYALEHVCLTLMAMLAWSGSVSWPWKRPSHVCLFKRGRQS